VISPYAITLTSGTSLNVIGISDIKKNEIVGINCTYFFEDPYCGDTHPQWGEPVISDCAYLKTNFRLEPELIITDSRANKNYTLYRVSKLDNKTKIK